jgi:colicin import membrane protein
MSRTLPVHDRGLGWGFAASVALHLVLTLFMLFFRPTAPAFTETPVYYVDMVNLPVASPQAGSPTVAAGAPAAPAPAPPKPPEMALPQQKPPTPKTSRQKPAPSPPSAETGREFEDRIAKLQRAIDERRQESAIENLRRKAAGSGHAAGPAGMPGGTGSQAGSDYASYLQSRLRDAFRATIAYQGKSPEVVIKLTIDAGGKIARQRIERSSGDRIFEESVMKAVARAEKTFTPPPGGGEFEYGFIFRPQGVGKQ